VNVPVLVINAKSPPWSVEYDLIHQDGRAAGSWSDGGNRDSLVSRTDLTA